jgi:hypothetical protein
MGPRSDKPLKPLTPADIKKALSGYSYKTYKCVSACCTYEMWAISGESVQIHGPCGGRLKPSYAKSCRDVASEVVGRVIGQCPQSESPSVDRFCRRVAEIEASKKQGVGD